MGKKIKRILNFDSYSQKRVSYILATRNHAKYLQEKIKDARKLLNPNDELIIIDGMSKDNTRTIVKKNSDIIDIFISESDISPANAVNKGILLARGKYIKEFPDDDEIYPEAMEEAIRVLEKHPEIDLLICGGTKQRAKGFSTVYLPPGTNYGSQIEDVFEYGACGVGFIVRRRSLAIGGLYPTGVASDNHFVLEYISKGLNVKFCRINLFNHQIYNHSTIILKSKRSEQESYELIKQYGSFPYYIRYRIKIFFSKMYRNLKMKIIKNSLLRILLLPLRIYAIKLNKNRSKPQLISPVWDGGFS